MIKKGRVTPSNQSVKSTLTGFPVFCQNEADSTFTARPGSIQPALVHAAAILNRAGIRHCARKETR